MHGMNEFLATGPFDLYELQLFHLVAEHGSFTKAGQAAGITQSAITRQIRGMEERLGVALFERTTRYVKLTSAGAALHARSGAILGEVNDAISAIKERFELEPKALRVGVARTIALAYLPGFFRRFQTRFPKVQIHVSQESSAFILAAVESGELEAGIVSAPPRMSRGLSVTNSFADEFTIIAPAEMKLLRLPKTVRPAEAYEILKTQRWIMISRATTTGKRLQAWTEAQGLKIVPALEADNFDLIVNLVSLGMGVGIVPHRTLALYPNRRPVQRINTFPKFSRELNVVVRRQTKISPVLQGFVENILY